MHIAAYGTETLPCKAEDKIIRGGSWVVGWKSVGDQEER